MAETPRRRKWPYLVAILAVATIGTYILLTNRSISDLDREIALASKAGLPTTAKELELPPIPKEKNAYPHYEAARKEITSIPAIDQLIVSDLNYILSTAPTATAQRESLIGTKTLEPARVRRVFDTYEKAIAPHFEKAQSLTEARFPEEDKVTTALRRVFMSYVRASDLLNDPRLLRLAVQRQRSIAYHQGSQPDGIHGLMAYTYQQLLEQLLINTLQKRYKDPAFVKVGLDYFTNQTPPIDVRNLIKCDIVDSFGSIDSYKEKPQQGHGFDLLDKELTWKDRGYWRNRSLNIGGVNAAVRARSVNAIRYLYEALPQDPKDFAATDKAFEEATQHLAKETSPIGNLMRDVTYADWSTNRNTWRRYVYTRVMGDAFVKVLDYNLKHRRFPANLADIPNVPHDPFTGKPFLYSSTGTTFTLKSFGLNGVDDAGKALRDNDDTQMGAG